MMLLCRCLRNRQKKNLHLLPHQRIIENKSRSMNMSLAEEDESNIFLEKLESCNNTFTNLLSRNFCDDGSNDDRLLAKKHKINNETFQNSYQSYQSSRTNPTTSQLSTTNAQPRKRADTLGSASLTVAAALNINLSSLGPLYSSSPAVRKESSSSSSNRVSRAPSPAPENNRFTTTTKKLK
jgi:hypothetical protein